MTHSRQPLRVMTTARLACRCVIPAVPLSNLAMSDLVSSFRLQILIRNYQVAAPIRNGAVCHVMYWGHESPGFPGFVLTPERVWRCRSQRAACKGSHHKLPLRDRSFITERGDGQRRSWLNGTYSRQGHGLPGRSGPLVVWRSCSRPACQVEH